MKTIAEVIQLMMSSTSAEDWNAKADQVKAAWGGQYPSFWFRMLIGSGISTLAQEHWPRALKDVLTSEIHPVADPCQDCGKQCDEPEAGYCWSCLAKYNGPAKSR